MMDFEGAPLLGDVITFTYDGGKYKGFCTEVDPDDYHGEHWFVYCPWEEEYFWVAFDNIIKVEKRNLDIIGFMNSYVKGTLPENILVKG